MDSWITKCAKEEYTTKDDKGMTNHDEPSDWQLQLVDHGRQQQQQPVAAINKSINNRKNILDYSKRREAE